MSTTEYATYKALGMDVIDGKQVKCLTGFWDAGESCSSTTVASKTGVAAGTFTPVSTRDFQLFQPANILAFLVCSCVASL